MRPAVTSAVFEPKIRRSLLLGLTLVLMLGLAPVFAVVVVAPGLSSEVYVDPDPLVGDDRPGRGTTAEPFLTIGYAFEQIRLLGVTRVSIRLRPGTYSDTGAVAVETFPITVPALDHVEIEGLGAEGGVVLSSADAFLPILQFESSALVVGASVTLRNLGLRGGLVAACFPRVDSTDLRIEMESLSAIDQAGTSIEVFGGPGATMSLVLENCLFQGARGGVTVDNAFGGQLDLRVEGSFFLGLRHYSPGGLLGAGVDVHLDSLGTVNALLRGNTFVGAASAIQFTTAPEHPDVLSSGGTLSALVVNNLVNGLLPSGVSGPITVRNGVYLSAWPHHTLDLQVLNNTFAGIRDYVVYQDNLADLEQEGVEVPLVFANNICFGIGAESEFNREVASDAPFPPGEMVILHNRLERSVLAQTGEGGNFNDDPLFVDAGLFDFRLSRDSLAVDNGHSDYAEHSLADLGGLCRRSASSCPAVGYPIDVGAHEREGLCEVETAVFQRGDCNQGSGVDLSDGIFTLVYLFLGGAVPTCMDACDANDDTQVNLSDGIFTLSHLFTGGLPPPAPYPELGVDLTPDCLPSCR